MDGGSHVLSGGNQKIMDVLEVLKNVGFIIAGFILLIKGADFFVDGASSVAGKIGIPQIVIGLTIVAFGTSAPEAAISISSAAIKAAAAFPSEMLSEVIS